MRQNTPPRFLPHIDIGEGLRRFGGNWDLFRQLIHQFIQLHEGIERNAWRLYHEGDFAALHGLAHRLRGAAANLSAIDLRERARAVESLALNGSVEAVETALTHMVQELDKLREMARTL